MHCAAQGGGRWPAHAGTVFREMLQCFQGLLQVPRGLAVGQPRQGLVPCQPEVRQGLPLHLTPEGMVGQPFDLLGHPIPSQRLQGLKDASMERPPPLLE
jgi:hypothetical protein